MIISLSSFKIFYKLIQGGAHVEEEKIYVKFIATITGQKGTCHANHKLGQKFELNCYDSGGLCGFFYHNIFPNLNVMQFDGKYPWWEKDTIEVDCPDPTNTVSLKIEKKK
jgi:uncharacterized repeat protein (TIGR04076 family)